MAGLASPRADVTRFEMAGRFIAAAALQKVAHTGYLFCFRPEWNKTIFTRVLFAGHISTTDSTLNTISNLCYFFLSANVNPVNVTELTLASLRNRSSETSELHPT
jgi:hypothetical protein